MVQSSLTDIGEIAAAKNLLCVRVIDYQSESDKVSDADGHSQQCNNAPTK